MNHFELLLSHFLQCSLIFFGVVFVLVVVQRFKRGQFRQGKHKATLRKLSLKAEP